MDVEMPKNSSFQRGLRIYEDDLCVLEQVCVGIMIPSDVSKRTWTVFLKRGCENIETRCFSQKGE